MHSKNLDLKPMRERWEASTPGIWKSSIEGRDHDSGSDIIMTDKDDFEISGATVADYDFIASAKQDIPLLIAEVEKLREQIAGVLSGADS